MHNVTLVMDTIIAYADPNDDSIEVVDAKFVSSLLSQLQLVIVSRRAVILAYIFLHLPNFFLFLKM